MTDAGPVGWRERRRRHLALAGEALRIIWRGLIREEWTPVEKKMHAEKLVALNARIEEDEAGLRRRRQRRRG